MIAQHEIQIRVPLSGRPTPKGVSITPITSPYFEQGRVELLRAAGFDYRRLEETGYMLVVAEITCQYYLPASYDDLLTIRTTTVSAKGARVEHRYEVFREGELLATGKSIVACINREGKVTRLPQFLLPD